MPGGSLNPPSKALNPIITTLGGVIGPVAVYFLLLEVFVSIGNPNPIVVSALLTPTPLQCTANPNPIVVHC